MGKVVMQFLRLLQLASLAVLFLAPNGEGGLANQYRHQCIHDSVQMLPNDMPFVQTKGSSSTEKRQSQDFAPIRIQTVFDLSATATPKSRSLFLDPGSPLQRALTVLSNTLLVRPLRTNFTIPPTCNNTITNGTNAGKCFADSVDLATACGTFFNVPSYLIGTLEACTTASGPCDRLGPDGPGVADSDYVLLAGATENCETSTPAYTSSCAKDSFNRPSAGYINLCLNRLDTSQGDLSFRLVLHEMIHALGFSANLMPMFIDDHLQPYNPVKNFAYDGSTISGLTSPKVVEQAQKFFNCSRLEYVALENNDGQGTASSHWEARILLHETMSPILNSDYNIFSNFTLSYFEDSGWYTVNYTYTNSLTQYELLWGKDLGCDFVLRSCDDPTTYPYHCNHLNTTHQCTFDGISKGTCRQSPFMDGCYTVLPDPTGACINFNNGGSSNAKNYIAEAYGAQSRCYEHSDECNSTVSFSCLETRLVRHQASGLLAYYLNVSGKVWCREGGSVYVEGRLITCPSVEFILLRADPNTITTVDDIPPPLCHKSCASCAVIGDANQCLSCPGDAVLLGTSPSNCSTVSQTAINVTDCPCTEGDLRLVNGSTQFEGRVEICLDGEWGVVCDDGFGDNDAKVVCRQLEFDSSVAQSVCCSTFGSGYPLSMTIDYLSCTGSESTISECSHNGAGVGSCDYNEAAGVRCGASCLSDDQVDLIITSGNPSNITSGIVRVCSNGSGGVVCDDGWDHADARVACKAAGYSPYGAVSVSNQQYLSSSNPPIMSNVGCSGNESYLSQCPSSDPACSVFDYAGVICQDVEFVPENCTQGDIRLVGGLKPYEGRVEVCINDVWGTVCDNGWSTSDANVVCKHAGFSGSGATPVYNAAYGEGDGPILLSGLTCSGFESSLLNCSYSLIPATCSHRDDAGVSCEGPCDGNTEIWSYYGPGIPSATSTGSVVSGIAAFCYQSVEYVVCDYGWDFAAAKVACRSAGLSPYGAVRLLNQYLFYFSFYSSVSYVQCDGSESSLTDCTFSYSFCYFFDYAGVSCQDLNTTSDGCTHGDVRLVNGSKENEGRVEICINELWGTICDSGWNTADAIVACRQAGFLDSGAVAHRNSYYGQGTSPALLSSFYCSGSEESLLNCSFSSSSYCSNDYIVGVTCLEPCDEGSVEILEPNGVVSSGGLGIVSVCMNGNRTVLCDYGWDSPAAKVVCQQLGFSKYGATALKAQYLPGQSLGSGYVSECEGHEIDLLDCLTNMSSLYYYCSVGTLAGVSCQEENIVPDNCTDGTIRLVGGNLSYEGDIQICHNNLWGAICDSGWSVYDAQVICKQLGYLFIGAVPTIGSYFGTSFLPVYYSNVGCSSSDSSIEQCYSSVTSTCGSNSYAGVVCGGACEADEIGLFSGSALYTSSRGIVQTCVQGVRGVICDSNWDHTEARVVCRQLGYSPYGALAARDQYLSSTYSCTLPDILTNINCTGEEAKLSECPFEYGSCSYSDTAGVVCQNTTVVSDDCTHGDIKLLGGNGNHEGTVHVCINGIWGTICDSGWSGVDAGVVCQQLGYERSSAQNLYNSYFGRGSGPVYFTYVGCSSSDSNILDCRYSLLSETSYCNDHDDDAGVICEAPCEGEGLVDLITSSGTLSSTASGVVRVCVNGSKGAVCDNSWGFPEAVVTCRAAGYSTYGAVPFASQYLSPSSSYESLITYVDCTGNETVLTQCSYSPSSYCYYYGYAGVMCQSETTIPDNCVHGDVRLAGSSQPWQGRVEVCINNLWTSVCDGGWSTNDAQTVCAQIGYSGTGAQALANSFFGDGTSPVLINSVACSSNSEKLLDCPFSSPYSYCQSGNTAGVICEVPCSENNNAVQLIQSSGVLKMCGSDNNDRGYLICDYGWDFVDAIVACKSLGLSPYGAVPLFNQYVSSVSGYDFLAYVSCDGTESALSMCDAVQRSSSCFYNYAGVQCQDIDTVPDNCTHGAVRLVGGSNEYEGNVEVCINGIWGTICDIGWSSSDARVACGDVGYPGAGASTRLNSYYGAYNNRPMLLSSLSCSSSDVSLLDCSFSAPSSSCDQYDIAGVVCEGPCSDGSVRLLQYSGSLNSTSGGVVQLCFEDRMFLVCDNGWDFADSRVLCQSVGYSPYGAVAVHNQALSSSVYNGLALLNYVSCNGTETNFTDCEYDVLYSGYCNYNFAGVYCQGVTVPDNCVHGDVRLTGGANEYEGTVEICINNLWGTICDSSWGSGDASVVCNQLGYLASGATARYNAEFGFGSGPVLMNNLQCRGLESSLLECTSSIPYSYCTHTDDAGVVCQAPCDDDLVDLISPSANPVSTSAFGVVRLCDNSDSSTANSEQLICDYGWDFDDAGVACKSLGYSPYGAVAFLDQDIFPDAGYSLLAYVSCNGSEENLSECQSQSWSGSCSSNYAGVACQANVTIPDNCTHGEIRLVGGNDEYEGNVEVCINSIWSTICDIGWSSFDATVACTQVGYTEPGAVARTNSAFGSISDEKPMSLSNLICSGSEESLLNCRYDIPSSSCDKYDIAGVVCAAPCDEGSVQLLDSSGSPSRFNSGIVMLCNSGRYLICDYYWDFEDASVACKSASYSPYGAIPLTSQYLFSISGYSTLGYINCNGSEETLAQCESQPWIYGCYYYSYAGVQCQENGTIPDNCNHEEIRLVGGAHDYEGNVEICINGIWSTICDRQWSSNDAVVACVQAGYPGAGAVTRTDSYFGAYEKTMLLSSFFCSGSESSLLECNFNSPSSSCNENTIAGVTCEAPCVDGEVELLQPLNGPSTPNGGVVEVCLNETQYIICDSGWDFLDSQVLCRHLGYSANGAIVLHSQALSASVYNSLPLLRRVACNGTESSLMECDYDILDSGNCNYNFAGVYCQENSTASDGCAHGELQLVNGSTNYEGNIRICVNGVWTFICDSSWNDYDASVACRQAGFPGGGITPRINSYFGPETGPVLLSSFQCSGRESLLLDCTYYIPYSYCDSFDIAGVTCDVPCSEEDVQLLQPSNGPNIDFGGVVQICLNDTKYLVCDNGWDYRDSSVLCQYLGYSPTGAIAVHNLALSSSAYSGLPLLSYVSCHGTEPSLVECDHDILLSGYCNYNFAGVNCQDNGTIFDNCEHGAIKLEQGLTEYEGNIKICYNDVWTTICHESWSSNDARVACTQAGYPGAAAIYRTSSYFGIDSGPMLLSGFSCGGSEVSLLDCRFRIPSSSCDQFDVAGVICEAPCAPGSVELVTSSGSISSTSSGVVRMCNSDGHYFLVCDGEWDYVDASIACKSAGYSPYGATRYHDQQTQSTAAYSFLTSVSCDGSESTLSECPVDPRSTSCSYDYAGVSCQGPTTVSSNCTHGDIRLVGGSTEYEGMIEVCVNEVWSTICDISWTASDALVACAQAGYPGPGAVSHLNSYYGVYDKPMLLSQFYCYGGESSLLDCDFRPPSYSCDKYDIAGVECSAPCTDGVNLLQSSGSFTSSPGGVVQLCLNQTLYLICDDEWNSPDASVLCQSLGYSPYGAVALKDQYLTSSVYYGIPLLLANITCDGTESSIAECSYMLSNASYCNYDLAGVYCQALGTLPDNCTHGDMKLIGGSAEYEGTLQVCVNSIWGTVCDSGWSYRDASLACSQLGYGVLDVEAVVNSRFGAGSGPVLLSGVSCYSSDTSLFECRSSIPTSSCDHSDDAGVVCEGPCNEGTMDLRVYGGSLSSTNSGLVSICVNGVQNFICDSNWDFVNARIVCETLGYSPYGAFPLLNQYTYTLASLINTTTCYGSESTLMECGIQPASGDCYGNLAGVTCQANISNDQITNCTNGDIRLVNGTNEYNGRVEVCANNVWGRVCEDGWSTYDARAVCRQLGFTGSAVSAERSGIFGAGSGPIVMSSVACSWNDPLLVGCRSYDPASCYGADDAGVICEGPCAKDLEVDLVAAYQGTLSDYNYGIVRLCKNGQRSPICDTDWDEKDARVACRSAGYSPYGAIAFKGQVLYSSDPALTVECSGNETDLSECTIGIGNCSLFSYAGISCQPINSTYEECENGAVRLVGGASELQGTVEICINNVWGTVCDSGWSVTDARVVCQQLGFAYSGAKAYYNAYFGPGSGPILLSSIYCYSGYEPSLLSCSHYYVSQYCDHHDDAGVSCENTNSSCPYGDIRLVDGPSPYEGRVEICINNVWGTVCDDDWGTPDAEVVCHQLGYATIGAVALPSATYGRGSGPTFLDNVACSGEELQLLDCGNIGIAYENCDHNQDAGVKCPVACPKESEALGTNLYIQWPQTAAGTQISVQCPCSIPTSDMYATRYCSGDAESGVSWEESNTANCSYDPNTLALCTKSRMVELPTVTAVSSRVPSTSTSTMSPVSSSLPEVTAVSSRIPSTSTSTMSPVSSSFPEATPQTDRSSTAMITSVFVVMIVIIGIAVTGIVLAIFVIRRKLKKQRSITDEVALCHEDETKSDIGVPPAEPTVPEKETQVISEM